jgi:Fe-S oxidoreductase
MAKMKVEFLHHYKAKHGYTFKDKLVAYLPDYAPLASRFAALLNLRDKIPGLAALSEKWLGLSSKRTLPQWQTKTFFNAGVKTASREQVLAAAKPVVLFVDTFNGYFESDNALSAVNLLQAAGYTVHVASKSSPDGKALCCGRTFLASGMVDEAKVKASELVNALLPFAAQGIAIVGLEPSCLLTLRDETLVMGLGVAAQTVSQHALLLEVFLAREAQMGYATVGIVTDYDCWMDDPSQHVSMNALLERYRQTMDSARALLETMLSGPLPEPERDIRESLAHAVMTPDAQLTTAQREWLGVLRR